MQIVCANGVCEEVAVAHLKRPQEIPFFVQSSVFVYNVNTFTVTYNTSTSSFVTLYGTDNIHSANGIGKTVRDHPYPTNKTFAYKYILDLLCLLFLMV